ncbi:glycoside hydrolase family 19 protein [Paraburkholderia bengalensis]|uniref:Glycoside hydrolase family 19 protein n=1 Tax=Paraburkholderia bengalensis TaxID=2747562 RepID=A0ABU8J434_9BURK
MTITPALLIAACGASAANAARFVTPLQGACDRFAVNTPQRLAAFLSQVGHESAGLSAAAESFNYSVAGLAATFRRMTPPLASILGRQPGEKAVPAERQQRIASIVYANQYGNGEAVTGDGWRYRGSGLIQLTFHDNFAACGRYLGLDLTGEPERVRTDPAIAALVAGWFWSANGCNALADTGAFDAITRRINRAMAGKAHRDELYAAAKHALGI